MTTATKTHQAKYKLLPNIKRPLYNNTQRIVTAALLAVSICVIFGITYFTRGKLSVIPRNESITKDSFEINMPIWQQRAEVYADSFGNQDISENNTIAISNPEVLDAANANSIPISTYKLICYYTMSDEDMQIESFLKRMDADLCTHLNVGFLLIKDCEILVANWQEPVLKRFSALKTKNPNLKVIVSIGGAGAEGFSKMVINHNTRKTFIKSILAIIHTYHLDGIDLDWEFPNLNAEVAQNRERQHFTQLLREIRAEINRQSKTKRFLLSVAVAAPTTIVDNSYDVDYMNEYVDYICIMTYDYHYFTKITPWTGLNAPLYNGSKDSGFFQSMNINYTANYWIQKGMDRSKIIIGLPTYGHSFKLLNPSNNGLQAPANGFGDLGYLGFIKYSQACAFVTKPGANTVFDIDSKSPYAYKDDEWISYDNIQSLTYKTDYIKSNNFGGVMIFSLNTDDFTGEYCGAKHSYATRFQDKTNFQLTHTVKNILFDDSL